MLPAADFREASELQAAARVDRERARKIKSLLFRMGLTQQSSHAWLIGPMNHEVRERLEMRMQAWLSDEELRAVQAFTSDGGELGHADASSFGLTDFKRLQVKIACLHYHLAFFPRVANLREWMALVVACVDQLITSEKFAAVMQHVFHMCCVITGGRDSGEMATAAKGFRMSSLTRLRQTRTFDPDVSVLAAMVQAIERDNSELADFGDGLTLLPECAVKPVGALRNELASLTEGYDQFEEELNRIAMDDVESLMAHNDLSDLITELASFGRKARFELRYLQLNLRALNEACRRLRSYLEEPEETPFDELVAHVAGFVKEYSTQRAKIL